MPSQSRNLARRALALVAISALTAGCATVPGDAYYYDSGYAPPYPSYGYPAGSSVTVYESPGVVYSSPPPGWQADAWRERQWRERQWREREWRNDRERDRERERDRWQDAQRRDQMAREQQRLREAQRQEIDRRREQAQRELQYQREAPPAYRERDRFYRPNDQDGGSSRSQRSGPFSGPSWER